MTRYWVERSYSGAVSEEIEADSPEDAVRIFDGMVENGYIKVVMESSGLPEVEEAE